MTAVMSDTSPVFRAEVSLIRSVKTEIVGGLGFERGCVKCSVGSHSTLDGSGLDSGTVDSARPLEQPVG